MGLKNMSSLESYVLYKDHAQCDLLFKGNAQLIFLFNPPKSSVTTCLMKILKGTVTKKVIMCFNNLGEESF